MALIITLRKAYFNPLAPRGARRAALTVDGVHAEISIHSPLAGRDDWIGLPPDEDMDISIHSPLAGRDMGVSADDPEAVPISIHSPLAGRDRIPTMERASAINFNPLAPRGARPLQSLAEKGSEA